MAVQLDCITFEYLPDDLLPAIDSVQCWVATELVTMAFYSLLCWSAAIMAMLANSQSREPDGENQGEIPESYLMETSEPACDREANNDGESVVPNKKIKYYSLFKKLWTPFGRICTHPLGWIFHKMVKRWTVNESLLLEFY